MSKLKQLNDSIVECTRCSRLRSYCNKIAQEKRKAYLDWDYWGKPVPNFGQSKKKLMIVGLAPGAHGANRTGRMFTGDRSGDWLYRALHKSGFANQAEALSRNDGLKLKDCLITAVCHCAPPDNKPSRDEVDNCGDFLDATFRLISPKVLVCLGQIAWKAVFDWAKGNSIWDQARPKFSHGAESILLGHQHIIASYHPSQQNTFTGRLTEDMLDQVFQRARQICDSQ